MSTVVSPVDGLVGRVMGQRRRVSSNAEWQKLTSNAGRCVNLIDISQVVIRYDEQVDAARNRHVLVMVTVVSTPTSMRTVRYGRLIAHTPHSIQPDRSGSWPVAISYYSAVVPKIHKRKSIQ